MNVLVSISKLALSAKLIVRVAMNFKLYVVITNSICQMIRLFEKRVSVKSMGKRYPSS